MLAGVYLYEQMTIKDRYRSHDINNIVGNFSFHRVFWLVVLILGKFLGFSPGDEFSRSFYFYKIPRCYDKDNSKPNRPKLRYGKVELSQYI